jgi:hypothetical protein
VPGESSHLPGATELLLDGLRRQLEAFDRHLAATDAQRSQLLRYRRDELRDALGHLVGSLREARELEPSAWDQVLTSANALARMLETPPGTAALEERRSRLDEAATAVHADLADAMARSRAHPSGRTLRALRRFQQAHEALDAELLIAAACRRLTAGLRGRALQERRRELTARCETVRQQLDERRRDLAEQRERSATLWRQLDAELRTGAEEAIAAFERMLAEAASDERKVAPSGKTRRPTRA